MSAEGPVDAAEPAEYDPSTRMTIRGQSFEDEPVELSNIIYEDCTFTNCVMQVRGGPVRFVGCTLNKVSWVFLGEAQHVLGVLRLICSMDLFEEAEPGVFDKVIADIRSDAQARVESGVLKREPEQASQDAGADDGGSDG